MGKGDRKTKRGKIYMGTFGVRRPHDKPVSQVKPSVVPEKEPVVPEPAPKATTKKKTTKK